MPDVVVLGSLNMDLVVRSSHIPLPGETVHGSAFVTIPGGKGANQAAATARLGAQTEMVGCVGSDGFGDTLLENMRAQGVGVDHIRMVDDTPSGIALITVADSGENSIVVAPGANACVTADDVSDIECLLAQAQLLVMQFEVPLPVVERAIVTARRLHVPVILNPAPAYAVEPGFLDGVQCLIVNETEVQTLSGRSVTDLDSAKGAAQVLLAHGVPTVIVTLGAQGALLVSRDSAAHVPARKVDVVDTTAAGDAFVGGFAVGLLRGLPLPEAVRYGTCAGTLAATVLGAQTSLPTASATDRFFEEALS